jgi:DNA invertase Pin-like site-specific DNA recombinase
MSIKASDIVHMRPKQAATPAAVDPRIAALQARGKALAHEGADLSGRLIGYARVSTDDQDLTMQTTRLLAAGVHPDNLHVDKASAVARKRPGLESALKDATVGDTVVVWKLDRFGRSVLDLLTRIKALQDRGVAFRSLTDNIDTATPIGNLILVLLSAIAQFERDLTAERTRAGIATRKAQGVRFGPKQLLPVAEAADLFRKGWSPRQVRDHYKLRSMSTVYRYFNADTVAALREEGRASRRRKPKTR